MAAKLEKVQAGLYRHPSGTLIIRTDDWQGPRGGSWSRWEHAERDEYGNIVVDSWATFRTLREAAADLEGGSAR